MTRPILSCRRSRLTMSRGLTYEFEDVITSADEQASIAAVAVPTSSSLRRSVWGLRNAARLVGGGSYSASGVEFVFAVAQCASDLADHLAHVRTIRGAHRSAAYVEEMWAQNLDIKPAILRLLGEFDHVFVGCAGTVGPLGELIDAPVSYLPPSVDQERFGASPLPTPVIDVYAMGRRRPEFHAALQHWAAADPERMYHYDTFTNNPAIADHAVHRAKLADFIRRCRYFLVNEGKIGRTDEIAGQSEVGYRFFEGAAAGTIMLGAPVGAPTFDELFGWEDSVVGVDPSGSDLHLVIKELEDDPERRVAIRRRNVRNSMVMHDPAHRWKVVLETMGLEVPPGVLARIDGLAERSRTVDVHDVSEGTR